MPQGALPDATEPRVRPFSLFREGAITNLSIKGFVQAADRRNCHPNGFKCGADTPVREPRQHPPATIPTAPCHPERSRAIREANGPAKSKDPYSLPISRERGASVEFAGGAPLLAFFEKGPSRT